MAQTGTDRQIEGIELPPVGTWKLDQGHTSVEFVARHMLTKTRGRFTSFDGTIVVGEGLEDSSVEVEIDAASIQSNVEQRDAHLRSPDFLDVEQWPKLTFTSTEIRPTGGNGFELQGDLTIRDITNEVVLDCEFLGFGPDPFGNTVMSFSGKTRIERDDWDMTWNVAVETGGFLVGKSADIEIDVEAVLQADEAPSS